VYAPPERGPAFYRRGGVEELQRRLDAGELEPDFGPARIDPRHGATLVTARPPLVAFNVDLASDDVELARSIAWELRESGGGLPGVRALGLQLPERGRAQVSLNVHDHREVPLAEIVARVRARAPVAECELVGLAPAAAFDGFPDDVPLRDFDPRQKLLENALGSVAPDGPDQAQAQA
jgi:glutamate formiminotransferase